MALYRAVSLLGDSGTMLLLATFAYRLFSYWLPLPFGLLGMALAPRRAGPPARPEPASP